MNRLVASLCLIFAAAFPVAAAACGGPGLALIHPTLPTAIPEDAIVAEVELLPDVSLRAHAEIRARLIRSIRGTAAPILILRHDQVTSCDSLYGNGLRGFVVAIPAGYENDIPVFTPLMAPGRPFDAWPLPTDTPRD